MSLQIIDNYFILQISILNNHLLSQWRFCKKSNFQNKNSCFIKIQETFITKFVYNIYIHIYLYKICLSQNWPRARVQWFYTFLCKYRVIHRSVEQGPSSGHHWMNISQLISLETSLTSRQTAPLSNYSRSQTLSCSLTFKNTFSFHSLSLTQCSPENTP
jgi:hypothetical protein